MIVDIFAAALRHYALIISRLTPYGDAADDAASATPDAALDAYFAIILPLR